MKDLEEFLAQKKLRSGRQVRLFNCPVCGKTLDAYGPEVQPLVVGKSKFRGPGHIICSCTSKGVKVICPDDVEAKTRTVKVLSKSENNQKTAKR